MRICIIGGGGAGLASLKVLKERAEYQAGRWEATLYEARDDIGGIWLPAPPTDNPPKTPLYDSLTTNLPHPVMAFQSMLFPPSTPLFPPASTVLEYLRTYAKIFDLLPDVRFNTPVKNVAWKGSHWEVTSGDGQVDEFDKVIVANGHYGLPRIPKLPGLDPWLKSGKASHSAWYRRPDDFGDSKTILVVGGGPSGIDLVTDLLATNHNVIHAASSQKVVTDNPRYTKRSRVVRFEEGGTAFYDDGASDSGIDHAVLATGYEHSYPFLPQIIKAQPPTLENLLPDHLYTSTYHTYPLARHLFPIQKDFPPDSIVFIGLLTKVAPLPVFEAQARATYKVFSDHSALDIERETELIKARYRQLEEETGGGALQIAKAWHILESNQWTYRNELLEFASPADYAKWKVESWTPQAYRNKDILRREWKDIEACGEAEQWLNGVGEGGIDDWLAFMDRLMERARGRQDLPIDSERTAANL